MQPVGNFQDILGTVLKYITPSNILQVLIALGVLWKCWMLKIILLEFEKFQKVSDYK